MQNSSVGISSTRVALIEGIISVLTLVLNGIDYVLVQAQKLFVASRPPAPASNGTSTTKPRVVIVGASFGGLAVEHALAKYAPSELQVTVIDYKEYFEYVPGALRCFIEPDHFLKGLSCPLSVLQDVNGTRVVSGEVVGVQPTADTCVTLKDGRTVPFDYLVLAAGSTYPSPIKATPAQPTMTQRQAQWHASYQTLKEAKTVLILGAGAVGVELASEILTKYPSNSPNPKRVLLVDTASQILPGFQPSSVQYCTQWLLQHGAELKLGAPLQRLDDHSAVWDDGVTVKVDLFYKCVGVAPATHFLKSTKNSLFGSALTGPRGSMVVNDHLQVEGLDHVFCIGDMCHHAPSSELKLGHTAEVNGHLAAANILRMIRNSKLPASNTKQQPLLSYPMGVVGNTVTPKIYNLSLGKYDATLGMNSMVIHGGLAAVVKWLLEWTKVAAAQQRPIGILFWIIADFVSNLLGRTILSTATPVTSTSVAAAAARDKRT